jgi:hypothetical protein
VRLDAQRAGAPVGREHLQEVEQRDLLEVAAQLGLALGRAPLPSTDSMRATTSATWNGFTKASTRGSSVLR